MFCIATERWWQGGRDEAVNGECPEGRGGGRRTLTPFGFQAEERTLWQAPLTYAAMSPFQNADLIKKPLLLIHGADDNNTGTFPLQAYPPTPASFPRRPPSDAPHLIACVCS